ncbi:hypothetical protein GGS21DRAFT_261798 [Xylaria nigripes]|nr:hypothetical protein GGS21DRAFT_261798 [Xylaria nigripes]
MDSVPVDLCKVPAGKSPDGRYNFENPVTLVPVVLSVSIILSTLSITLTGGRTYMNRHKLGVADYVAIIACVINIGFTGDILAQVNYSRHQWNIPVCWLTPSYFKLLYVQSTFFAPVFFASKASIFFLYLQLFGVQNHIRTAVRIGLVVSGFLYIPNFALSAIFEAPSAGQSWESLLTADKSHKLVIWGIIQSSLTIVLDFYIFFLPMPIIVRLNMSFARRLQLMAIFTTALTGIVASVGSLAYRVLLLHTQDKIWQATIVAIFALIETHVAIIVSCMPAFAQMLKLYIGNSATFKSLRTRLFRSSSSGNDSDKALENGDRTQLVTFGGSGRAKGWRRYLDLSDTAILKTLTTNTTGDARTGPPEIQASVVDARTEAVEGGRME